MKTYYTYRYAYARTKLNNIRRYIGNKNKAIINRTLKVLLLSNLSTFSLKLELDCLTYIIYVFLNARI